MLDAKKTKTDSKKKKLKKCYFLITWVDAGWKNERMIADQSYPSSIPLNERGSNWYPAPS